MKKIFFVIFSILTVSSFAQDTVWSSLADNMASASNSLWFDIFGVLIDIFFFIVLPILLYCISSYSLSVLNKHYNKKSTSRISWVPFVRYYDFVKQATKSPKKAFSITLLPWIMTATGLFGGILIGMIEKNIDTWGHGWTNYIFTTFGIILILGVVGIAVMSFWRAFIIAKHVKGDITTALGLSTYTALVLWYIALDRVRKSTNIIGVLWFILLGLVLCFYVGVIYTKGISGVGPYLGN